MIYRLLAINIDGSLIRSNGRLQKGVKEAIDFVREKGVYVTLYTSRNFQSAHKVAKALKLDSLLVTHSGAFVASSLDEPFVQRKISEEKTFNLVQVLEHFDCNIRISHERFSLGNRRKLSSNLIARAVLSNADPVFYPIQFVESLGDTLRDQPVEAARIDVFFASKQDKEKALQTVRDAFEDVNIIECNGNKIEILPTGVSKLRGLQIVGQHLGIATSEMVIIGDSIDDLEAIEHAGLGVAMGNATIEVKRAAGWITRSNNENGVTYMIKEHFRKQFPLDFLKDHIRIKRW
ncbi:Cof-type HAD-IIB family hydrolase [Ectobacillus antri]|uniref:Cof-type HAD-IIB family hydrolase n=1 Tax=Ectobacillus antri TaxID=2486280 RepID=A0ABT6H4B3_9BACI|nr:Cof-type HAD-IIB family hydrolase [Ectobacillus antri]MDG4656757.1 Cof-type HAD-IIB family hydrolase [Ectobacillus antri]MDG5753880.1 Cof-type HAD-IIB family hydrolase [Ectobacillus antri]